MKAVRYECPECGNTVDLTYFGTPHHSGLACVNCDGVPMGQVGEPEGFFDGLVEDAEPGGVRE